MKEKNSRCDELLTAEEVGQLLRVRAATVYEAASDGRLPCLRIWEGKRKALVRFRLEDIQKLLTARAVPRKAD